MRKKILLGLLLLASLVSFSQEHQQRKQLYEACYDSLKLSLQRNGAFKKAVFLTENCYLQNQMSYSNFDSHIAKLAIIVKAWINVNPLKNYRYQDSLNFKLNLGIYRLMKDTLTLIGEGKRNYSLMPYTYDFKDFTGDSAWSNMFVTKLLDTHSGNCHSLPYLYKMLSDELGATCWLSLAPNHMYIKNRCKSIGWYNTELTSGTFPMDGWIMASGYLPLEAIQNGIYMDTLSNQQSIALCVLDLAKGYEHQTKNYEDGFILKCCDLSLKYFPKNVQAMLLKAETLKHVYEKQKVSDKAGAKKTYEEMEGLYIKLFDLGYREMPDKMYQNWLQSVNKEKEKYQNRQMKHNISKG